MHGLALRAGGRPVLRAEKRRPSHAPQGGASQHPADPSVGPNTPSPLPPEGERAGHPDDIEVSEWGQPGGAHT